MHAPAGLGAEPRLYELDLSPSAQANACPGFLSEVLSGLTGSCQLFAGRPTFLVRFLEGSLTGWRARLGDNVHSSALQRNAGLVASDCSPYLPYCIGSHRYDTGPRHPAQPHLGC